MLHSHTRRGRPKGTGIDDNDRIARLNELLRIRPGLRPTTAIRLMGYSDPSAIRRLRDKYKAFAANVPDAMMSGVAAVAGPLCPGPIDANGAASPASQPR